MTSLLHAPPGPLLPWPSAEDPRVVSATKETEDLGLRDDVFAGARVVARNDSVTSSLAFVPPVGARGLSRALEIRRRPAPQPLGPRIAGVQKLGAIVACTDRTTDGDDALADEVDRAVRRGPVNWRPESASGDRQTGVSAVGLAANESSRGGTRSDTPTGWAFRSRVGRGRSAVPSPVDRVLAHPSGGSPAPVASAWLPSSCRPTGRSARIRRALRVRACEGARVRHE